MKRDRSFIAWISTLLKPLSVEDEKYIYKEGEEVTESKPLRFNYILVYFLVKGAIGYVLPRLDNKAYFIFEQGEHFGHVDIASDRNFVEFGMYSRGPG